MEVEVFESSDMEAFPWGNICAKYPYENFLQSFETCSKWAQGGFRRGMRTQTQGPNQALCETFGDVTFCTFDVWCCCAHDLTGESTKGSVSLASSLEKHNPCFLQGLLTRQH